MNNNNVTGASFGDALARFPHRGPNGLPWGQLVGALLVLTACTWLYLPTFDGVSAPFTGYRSPLEPGFLVRTRFATGASTIISEGYAKVPSSVKSLEIYPR
ncbi:Cytochrome P450 monooxygenase [Tolypocladium paradoxum]|uniref:Cytochrome P450 monooxygenase n=1 Tax=Tolypocladium paradoxum TaxID=94208 RepID=A0A2S4KNA9_9HYPO|nr:Cytochrome P450 monooxygenase [Tolypocladium paradoxum]